MSERRPLSKRIRFQIFARDNFTCQYCGAKGPDVRLHVDHIRAVARGGSNDPGNLATACFDCNMGKRTDYAIPPRMQWQPSDFQARTLAALEQAHEITFMEWLDGNRLEDAYAAGVDDHTTEADDPWNAYLDKLYAADMEAQELSELED